MIIKKVFSTSRMTLRAVRSFLWRNSSAGRKHLERLSKLRNTYRRQKCYIMGNGPSLLKVDFTLLKNELTIGSNGIYLIKDKMGFLPTFLTVEDVLVAEDRAEELNSISGTTKIFPRNLSYCLKEDENSIFVNFVQSYRNFPKFSDDFHRRVYYGGTVSFLNMQLAHYLGCSEIYLIGFDHNYKIKDEIRNNIILSNRTDENHIHPNYFGPGYRWHDPKVWKMENSYVVAKKFLIDHGVKIYNATVGGKLEVFERIKFENTFL